MLNGSAVFATAAQRPSQVAFLIRLTGRKVVVRQLTIHRMPEAPDDSTLDLRLEIDRIQDASHVTNGIDFVDFDPLRRIAHFDDLPSARFASGRNDRRYRSSNERETPYRRAVAVT